MEKSWQKQRLDESVCIRESVIKSVYSSLGRFTQADSVIPAGIHPHFMGAGGLDRYAYVNNAPVNLTDPSGHMVSDGLNGEGGGCDRLCLDSLGSRDEEKQKLLVAKPSTGEGGSDGGTGTGDGVMPVVIPARYGGTAYILSEEDLVYLSEHYEDIGQMLGSFAIIDAAVGAFCTFYCQSALPFLALGFALIANESAQAFQISAALDESAHWADQQEYEFTTINFNENEVLLFDQISYTDDLGYIQTDNRLYPK